MASFIILNVFELIDMIFFIYKFGGVMFEISNLNYLLLFLNHIT